MCLNAGHAHQKTLNSHEEERLKHGADRRHELIEAAPKTVCPTEPQLRRNPQFQAFSRSRRIGSPFSHTFSLSLSFLLPLMSYRPPFATPAPAISIVVGRQAAQWNIVIFGTHLIIMHQHRTIPTNTTPAASTPPVSRSPRK